MTTIATSCSASGAAQFQEWVYSFIYCLSNEKWTGMYLFKNNVNLKYHEILIIVLRRQWSTYEVHPLGQVIHSLTCQKSNRLQNFTSVISFKHLHCCSFCSMTSEIYRNCRNFTNLVAKHNTAKYVSVPYRVHSST